MAPRIHQIDNADALPPYNGGDTAPYEHPRSRARVDWPAEVARWVGGIVLLLVLYWLIGADVRAWIGSTEGLIVKVFVGVVALGFAWKRWWIVRIPGNYPVSLREMTRMDAQRIVMARLDVEKVHAGTSGRLLAQQTYSPTYHQQAPQLSAPAQVETVTTVPMLPPAEWLPWFDTRPHGLLAAETGGGKSTTFKAVVKSRIERGELVFLIDPHSSDWFGLPSIGGGEDWRAVWCGMQVVIEEYTRRMQERDAYLKANGRELPHDYFRRITVLLDEANTACLELTRGTRRGEKSRWDQFALALGSGARKVGLSIQLLAQSANVEDLGMSGPMVHNFTRLCLDSRSVLYLVRQSGDDPERKRELLDTINGQPYPAAALQNGRVVLLDRTGLDQVGTPHNPHASLWTEGYERAEMLIGGRQIAQQPTRPVVAANAQASATVRASVPVATGAIVYPATVQSTNGKIAWLLRQGYSYRQIERELSVSHQTISMVSRALKQRGTVS